MNLQGLSRRTFLKTAGILAIAGFGRPFKLFASEKRRLVAFPEKKELILLTSRPPNLETPLNYFKELITPEDVLFVRWHVHPVPTSVDLNLWRLRVGGNTEKELLLSMDDIKKLEKVTYTAVIQCSGNGRSFFEPRVAGGQWGNGAMGNCTWGGVRLRDVLNIAGIKPGSVEVTFDGLDSVVMPSVPDFIKSLPVDKALEDDVLLAYEINGRPLPVLNGFPLRLIVPGWYATYWVKSLTEIKVIDKAYEGFWMKPAYRIPDNPCGCVPPGESPKKTVPISRMTTRSLILEPEEGAVIKTGRYTRISGIAFSGGYSIKDVIVSVDGGRTWHQAELGRDLGRYSWIQWSYMWRPEKPGVYTLMAKATNSIGESQPFESLWNPSGYLWNKIEKVVITVKQGG